ncbi:MAG TPA: ABC transporter permease [Phycisphaerales bacterium]|nr:ABC transporter permease [Phycisphaerales bacterium]
MRAPWRLAISSAWQRRSRTALLIGVVALAAMLVSAVGTAMGSLREAIRTRVVTLVGNADASVKAVARGQTIPASLLDEARSWPGVTLASPRLEATVSLRFGRPAWTRAAAGIGPFERTVKTSQITANCTGLVPDLDARVHPIELLAGRMPAADNEVVIDKTLADQLAGDAPPSLLGQFTMSLFAQGSRESSKADPGPASVASEAEAQALNTASRPAVGDRVEAVRFGKPPLRLTIVGIAKPPPLGAQPWAYTTIGTLASAVDQQGRLSRIDLILDDEDDAQALASAAAAKLPKGVAFESTEGVRERLEDTLRINQLAFTIATLMASISAGFIIMTGMSTALTERQREMAMLRCIGATRAQLALSQIMGGAVVGGLGALVGVPLGVLAAWSLLTHYQDKLQAPVFLSLDRIAVAFAGAVLAGVLGALIPAFQASRVTPLAALAARARPARPRAIALITACGLALVAVHLTVFLTIKDPDRLMYSYLGAGLPSLMLGYFLLGVPAVLLVARIAGPIASRLMGIPAALLQRSIRATPYRFGFTAGAMMAGLALMVAIWTQGTGILRDWLQRFTFPDAFVVGLNMPPEALQKLAELPFVTDTSAVSLHPVETRAFGLQKVTRVKTFFVAFEPAPFFRMSNVEWIEGDEDEAIARLERGGAVIVAREFRVARGMGVGGTFTCWDDAGNRHDFEIVGIVSSPGLEIANEFFDVGKDFTEQRVHAVFGSRADLRDRFGVETIGLIQASLSPDVPDSEAIPKIRETLAPYGILNAGSGRELREQITGFARTALVISSSVAVFAMVVAAFGVANLVIAGVHARRFEFGVLRAVGAPAGLLPRLVLAEAGVIALAACTLGTLMGVQGVFGGLQLNRVIWGIDFNILPPLGPIALGWLFEFAVCLGAAGPTALALARLRPRELLGAIRG